MPGHFSSQWITKTPCSMGLWELDRADRGLVSGGLGVLRRPLKNRCSVRPGCPSCQGWLICDLPASDKDSSVLTKLNPSRFHLSFGSSRASTIPRTTCLFRRVAHAAIAKPVDSSQRHLRLHCTELAPVSFCLTPFWLFFYAAMIPSSTGPPQPIIQSQSMLHPTNKHVETNPLTIPSIVVSISSATKRGALQSLPSLLHRASSTPNPNSRIASFIEVAAA
jgi:hypothetical protein